MQLPEASGPVSRQVRRALRTQDPGDLEGPALVLPEEPVLSDHDAQLALWTIYELSYRGFDDIDDRLEWHPAILAMRLTLERRFEHELREVTRERAGTMPGHADIGDQLLALVGAEGGPRLSSYLRRDATAAEMRDYLRERSVQQLKESDPQSFLLPRLAGAAKTALAEVQYDEYGAGSPERLHQTLYAQALEATGLDPRYGAYVQEVSGISLAAANVMSLFALNRRLLPAGLGHFAALEASSSLPSRRIASGIERLGLPVEAARYFHEHVEADAVHEQVAARDVCGAYLAAHPEHRPALLFGAVCALHLEALAGAELLDRWHHPATAVAAS
jgi:Iron-containing redox enzyme